LAISRSRSRNGNARKVIAVASGEHDPLLNDLGADIFVDYTKRAAEAVAHYMDERECSKPIK